jgi:hypothetical protein
MNAVLVAFLMALGASVWVFTKLQDRTGYGNQKSALTGAGVSFVLIFLVVFTLAHMTMSSIGN